MKKIKNNNKPLTIELKNDQLVISVGIDTIKFAAANHPINPWDITNSREFVLELIEVLEDIPSLGTDVNRIEHVLEECINEVYMNGSKNIKSLNEKK